MDLWSNKKDLKDDHRAELRKLSLEQEEEMKLLRVRHFEEDRDLFNAQAEEMRRVAECIQNDEEREVYCKEIDREYKPRRNPCDDV
ncbi:hypothetical protein GEMRC1_007683 [Eukaryota sp. GEM-RC1]